MQEKYNGYNIPEDYSLEAKELIKQGRGWTPDKANEMLRSLGFEKENWDEAAYNGPMGSHEWRAYVRIAQGNEVHLLGHLVMQIREEEDGLPPVR